MLLLTFPLLRELDDTDRALVADVDLAMRRAGLDVTEAAYTMGLDPAQWTRQRHGEGHISLYRLARLSPAFWKEFAALRLSRVGCRVFDEGELTAALLQIISLAKKPMASMRAKAKARIA